jgi:hypothetical protein
MFDDHRVEFKSPEKVFHEYKRAPTDESIRLAKEYEEKIHSQIAEKLMVIDNNINFTCAMSNDAFMMTKLYLKININGVDHSGVVIIDFPDQNKIVDKIRDWICSILTMNITMEFFNNYIPNDFGYTRIGDI